MAGQGRAKMINNIAFALTFLIIYIIFSSHNQYRNSAPMLSRYKRICVFCGSSPGKNPSYQLAAVQLANELVERKIDLVYGGGSIGLMGLVSRAVYDGGRHVLGIIPKALMPREIIGEMIGDVMLVSDMHQRKAEMARHADAFIALPGGYGTFEELFEVITWAQLRIHDKPVGLLNVDGYYNSLLSLIIKAVDEGFIAPSARHIIVSAPTAHELMSKLEVLPSLGICRSQNYEERSQENSTLYKRRIDEYKGLIDYCAKWEAALAREFFPQYAIFLGFLCLWTLGRYMGFF